LKKKRKVVFEKKREEKINGRKTGKKGWLKKKEKVKKIEECTLYYCCNPQCIWMQGNNDFPTPFSCVCVCVCVYIYIYRHTHIILSLNILFHIIFFIQFDIHSFDYFFLSLILFSMLSLNILFYFIFVSDFGSYSFNF
jgi:hypothetical protein